MPYCRECKRNIIEMNPQSTVCADCAPAPSAPDSTLWGQIAAIYGKLDAEDCARVDSEWMRMRGIAPSTPDSAVREEYKAHLAAEIAMSAEPWVQPSAPDSADAQHFERLNNEDFAKEIAKLAQDLCGSPIEDQLPITAILASAAKRIAPSMPDSAPAQLMNFFSENVDKWGAAEWFNRLATAVRQQDAAVLAGNELAFETCKNVASSSAMQLVRDYEQQVRAALAPTAPDSAPTLTADCARLLPGGKLDDSTYEQIEIALDKIEAPCRGKTGNWLTLVERILASRAFVFAKALADWPEGQEEGEQP